MAGTTNSFFDSYAQAPTPCINDVQNASIFNNWALWLLVGVVIGSLSFQKKKETV